MSAADSTADAPIHAYSCRRLTNIFQQESIRHFDTWWIASGSVVLSRQPPDTGRDCHFTPDFSLQPNGRITALPSPPLSEKMPSKSSLLNDGLALDRCYLSWQPTVQGDYAGEWPSSKAVAWWIPSHAFLNVDYFNSPDRLHPDRQFRRLLPRLRIFDTALFYIPHGPCVMLAFSSLRLMSLRCLLDSGQYA